jgi:hypothetical protein
MVPLGRRDAVQRQAHAPRSRVNIAQSCAAQVSDDLARRLHFEQSPVDLRIRFLVL